MSERHPDSPQTLPPIFLLAYLAQAQENARLRVEALQDSLTGLPNRRAFYDEAERLIGQYQRHPGSASLVLLDLDNFKRINDMHGHPAGDEVLVQVARSMSGRLRKGDFLARLGGEEFGIIVRDADKTQAAELADRIRLGITEEVRVPLAVGSQEYRGITVSAGINAINPSEGFFEADFRGADVALYKAKELGRDRAVIFGN